MKQLEELVSLHHFLFNHEPLPSQCNYREDSLTLSQSSACPNTLKKYKKNSVEDRPFGNVLGDLKTISSCVFVKVRTLSLH